MTATEARKLADKRNSAVTPDINARRRKFILDDIDAAASCGAYSYKVEMADFSEEECVEFEKLGYKVKRLVHKIIIPSGEDVTDLMEYATSAYFMDNYRHYHKVEHIYEYAIISWGEDVKS